MATTNILITLGVFFGPIALTTTAQTVYTVPNATGNVFMRGRARFANTTSVAISASAYSVPAGGSAVAGNQFINQKTVNAFDYLDSDIPVLGPGDFMQALGGASGLTLTMIDGILFSQT